MSMSELSGNETSNLAPDRLPANAKETPIYLQPLPTASIVETFLLQAHTT
jgi:hypothetical protein